MGRRPAASRNQEIAQMAAGPIGSSKRVELQPEGPGSETMNQKLETSHRPMEKRNSKLPLQDKVTGTSSRKRPKCNAAPIRRSLRIRNGAVFAGNKSIEPVAEEILTISETENETESETEPQIEREDEQPPDNVQGSFSHKKSMEEKLDRVVKLLEAMISKRNNMRNRSYAFSKSPYSTYESLHADSQKIESLTKENRELSLKLNVALAEFEGYKNGSRAASEMVEKLKDVIIISNMAKNTEAALNLPSQAAGGAHIPHALNGD